MNDVHTTIFLYPNTLGLPNHNLRLKVGVSVEQDWI